MNPLKFWVLFDEPTKFLAISYSLLCTELRWCFGTSYWYPSLGEKEGWRTFAMVLLFPLRVFHQLKMLSLCLVNLLIFMQSSQALNVLWLVLWFTVYCNIPAMLNFHWAISQSLPKSHIALCNSWIYSHCISKNVFNANYTSYRNKAAKNCQSMKLQS